MKTVIKCLLTKLYQGENKPGNVTVMSLGLSSL